MQAKRISEELTLSGIECSIIKNINLAKIKDGNAVSADYDFCVFLDKDKAAARLLEKCGVKLFNSASAIEICDDKILTHIAFKYGEGCGYLFQNCLSFLPIRQI